MKLLELFTLSRSKFSYVIYFILILKQTNQLDQKTHVTEQTNLKKQVALPDPHRKRGSQGLKTIHPPMNISSVR